MPIYEYECLKCGKKFELRRSISDSDKDVACPYCRDQNIRRIFSTFAASLSGNSSCASGGPT